MTPAQREKALLALGRLQGMAETLAVRAIEQADEGNAVNEMIEDQVQAIREALTDE